MLQVRKEGLQEAGQVPPGPSASHGKGGILIEFCTAPNPAFSHHATLPLHDSTQFRRHITSEMT